MRVYSSGLPRAGDPILVPDPRHILLLIETSKAYGRCLLEGIGRYAETHGRWSMYVQERGLGERLPTWMQTWRGDGIIFRSDNLAMVRSVKACGVPAVDTNSKITGHGFPLVYADEAAIARVAVAHFQERRFDHFGFCSIEEEPWVQLRRQAYIAELAGRRLGCCYLPAEGGEAELDWERQLQRLAQWVVSLPKPIAVFAANDIAGMRLIDACTSVGVAVPEQVAVLGADNDVVLDKLTSPPLSSIDLDVARIGYEAASMLDRMMQGESPPSPILLPPAGVVARQSTDITAVPDAELAAALTFIRRHACDGINVHDVVARLNVSRATLERRFAEYLHRTPKDEILRVRIEQVKRLLSLTESNLGMIAEVTGFKTPSHLSIAFKRIMGASPAHYRSAQKKVRDQPQPGPQV